MKLNKKAALEISITTVVILIIAITVLGLAIPFIKNVFGKAGDIFENKFEEIKNLLEDDLTKGELLNVYPPSGKVVLGKKLGVAVGVRSSASSEDTNGRVCFRLQVKCVKPFDIDNFCDRRNQENDITVGGIEYDRTKPKLKWFEGINPEFDLEEGQKDVFKSELTINDAKPDTYDFELRLYKAINNRPCKDADFGSEQDSLYATKNFRVELTR